MTHTLALRGVYLITPDQNDTAALLAATAPLLAAGVALLQYRNKTADAVLGSCRHRKQLLHACCPAVLDLLGEDRRGIQKPRILFIRRIGAEHGRKDP